MAPSEVSALLREAQNGVMRAQKLRDQMSELRKQVTSQARQVHNSVESLLLTMHGLGASARIAPAPAIAALDAPKPDGPAPNPEDRERLKLLTPREIEVLRLIGQGERTKEIAFLLGITFKTAVTHRSNIMEKLGIHEGPRLVRFAIRAGICKP